MLKVDKKNYKETGIYCIGYVTVKEIINEIIDHFEEKHQSKYLVLDDVDEKKEVSKNIKKFGSELKKILKGLMEAKSWIWKRF